MTGTDPHNQPPTPTDAKPDFASRSIGGTTPPVPDAAADITIDPVTGDPTSVVTSVQDTVGSSGTPRVETTATNSGNPMPAPTPPPVPAKAPETPPTSAAPPPDLGGGVGPTAPVPPATPTVPGTVTPSTPGVQTPQAATAPNPDVLQTQVGVPPAAPAAPAAPVAPAPTVAATQPGVPSAPAVPAAPDLPAESTDRLSGITDRAQNLGTGAKAGIVGGAAAAGAGVAGVAAKAGDKVSETTGTVTGGINTDKAAERVGFAGEPERVKTTASAPTSSRPPTAGKPLPGQPKQSRAERRRAVSSGTVPKRRRLGWLVALGLLLLLIGAALLLNFLLGNDDDGESDSTSATTAVEEQTSDADDVAADEDGAADDADADAEEDGDAAPTTATEAANEADEADTDADDAELGTAVDSALADANVENVVTATVDGGVATLTGNVTQAKTRADAVAAAEAVEGVTSVDDQITGFAPGSLDTYVVEASGVSGVTAVLDEDGAVVLTGTVPSDIERLAVVDAVERADGVSSVDDQLELASTEASTTTTSEAATTTTTSEAATTTTTSTTTTTTTIPAPTDAEVANAVGVAISTANVSGVTTSVVGGVVTLTGRVPDDATRASAVTAANGIDGVISVDDQLVVAPSDVDIRDDLIAQLEAEDIAGVTVAVVQGAITLTGEAADGTTRARVETLATGTEGVTTVTNTMTIRPGDPAALQASLNSLIASDPVTFEFNSRFLDANGESVLDRVAPLILAQAGLNVEVGGHTDNIGSDSINQLFSQRRAEAVRDYLIGQGVAASRLSAVGFGSSDPIASNATVDGQERNRRIEFTVQ